MDRLVPGSEIAREIHRLTEEYRLTGTIVTDKGDYDVSDQEAFESFLNTAAMRIEGGVQAGPLTIWNWIQFGRELLDWYQKNPQLVAAFKELAELIRAKIAELTGGDPSVV